MWIFVYVPVYCSRISRRMGLVIIGVLMYLSISIWSPRAVAVMVVDGSIGTGFSVEIIE